METTKKQHYVPRFYLKNFGSPIYCYDKFTDKIFTTSPSDIGHENYFYDLKGVSFGTIEKLLANGDGRFSQAYNRLTKIHDLTKLTSTEKLNFFIFIAFQILRTPEFKEGFKDLSGQMLEKLFGKEGANVVPPGLKVTFSDETIRKVHIQSIFEYAPRLATILLTKTWMLRENHTDLPLITSDSPIALHNQLQFENSGNLGFLCPGLEIHFPLTPELILISYDPQTHRISSSETDKEHVRRHNNYQVTNSTRFLYSKTNNFDDAREFLRKFPDYKKPNRKRGILTRQKNKDHDILIFDKEEMI